MGKFCQAYSVVAVPQIAIFVLGAAVIFNKQKLEMMIATKIKVIGILPGHVVMTHVKKYEEAFIIGRVSTVGTQQRSDLSKVANFEWKNQWP
jgi:hypothetical protein